MVVLEPCKLGMAVRISLGAPLNGHLDQRLDPRSHKPVVLGSNPRMPTINYNKIIPGYMKINRSYKFRIYPTESQGNFINKNIGACRFIYNKMLADKIEYYRKEKRILTVTPANYKKEFEWLKQMDAYALCNEQMNLQTAYNNFFKNPEIGFPKFKSKKQDKSSYTTSNVNGVIRIINSNYINLPKIKNLRIKLHRQLPENCKIKSATIERKSSGKYYISILIEYENQVPIIKLDKNKSIGLDYSSSSFYVDSDGNKANYPKYFRVYQNKLAKEQRKLSRMVFDSKNYQKQKLKIAKINEKIHDCRLDFLHKLAVNISNIYDYVFVEDINMQSLAQCLNLGKSTNDNAFGSFRIILRYKLNDRGKKLIKIWKFEPTSIVCSECGAYHKDVVNSLSIRNWICPDCGCHHDRDINAAKNILKLGLKLVD